ncbi:MAG: Spo0E family sporulation regulatory protein-aspartic acid phosphatase [Bacillota bacterium]
MYLELEKQRLKLTEMVKALGSGHPDVLKQSKRVDKLVNEIQRRRAIGTA